MVVPTRNEEDNVGPLLGGSGLYWSEQAEIIVVDDSDDGTPGALAGCARSCQVPGAAAAPIAWRRDGGLSGAVIAGARHARGGWVLVMDADLQHPPETAAALAEHGHAARLDIVVGTQVRGRRIVADGLAGAGRGLVSSWSTRLVKACSRAGSRR